jgi:hypothetical protein
MCSILSRRLLAVTVAALLVWLQAAPGAVAADTALLRGRVVSADGVTPRAGVVITLVDDERGSVFRSRPSDDRGVFNLDSARPGRYTLVAEVPEGAFVAADKVNLAAGPNPAVALALQPAEPQETDSQDSPPEEGIPAEEDQGAEASDATLPPPPVEKEGLSPVVKGVIAGVVGLVAVATVYLASEEEDPGSPF